jgi:hypothetical protein
MPISPVWKVLASIAAIIISGSAGFAVLLTLAWLTPGADENREAAINTTILIGFLGITLLFSGLALWQIWLDKLLSGLLISLGAWIAFFAYVMGAEGIISLLERKN